MNVNNLTYKGFTGSCEISLEDDCLFGRILFIEDIITFEGQTTAELKTAFEEAVDRYLVHCKKTGKPANKPYSGSFNVRIGADLHRKAAIQSHACGLSLNEFVVAAIEAKAKGEQPSRVVHSHYHTITVESEEQFWTLEQTSKLLNTYSANTYAHQ